jgi:DNA-binding HxlR family transcriptional regulator
VGFRALSILLNPIPSWQSEIGVQTVTCNMQGNILWFGPVSGRPKQKRRSDCPVSISLEILGDRWSLLIVRDLMVRGFRSFKEFEGSGEGIATNILAHRLRKLEAGGIITAEPDEADRRRISYRLTEKGIDLAPMLLELLIWGARYEGTAGSCSTIEVMVKNRERIVAEVRRRWQERKPNPLQVNGEWRLPV